MTTEETTMSETVTDSQLDLARERNEYLEAEVARLRAERSAMLDALEAGQGLADLDTAPWEDRQGSIQEWDERMAHVHNLIGDDDE